MYICRTSIETGIRNNNQKWIDSTQSITKSLRLKKASKVIESNLWPIITLLTKPQYWVPRSLNICRDSDSTMSLGSPFQNLKTLFTMKFFLIYNLNFLWRLCLEFATFLKMSCNSWCYTSGTMMTSCEHCNFRLPHNIAWNAGVLFFVWKRGKKFILSWHCPFLFLYQSSHFSYIWKNA